MRHPVTMSERALPQHDGLRPVWPGAQVGGLHVRKGPDGREPGLFVHGLGGSATNWTDLMGLLEGVVDSEAVDLPGFGHSPPPVDGRYTVGAHARAVIGHLERSGRGPVHLFGNSLGGAVSTRVAADRPDLVRTLTLVSPALPVLRRVRGSDPRLPLLLLPGLAGMAVRRLAAQSPERRARAVLELCYGDPSAIAPQRLREAAEEVRRRNGLTHAQDAFTASLRCLVASYVVGGSRSPWARAARVQAPVLLVWGDRDRLVDVSIAPRAARTCPDVRLLVLPGVGHVAQMERPETVARAFLGMLEELATRSSSPSSQEAR
ncbi:MAG: Putative hydrolase [uncultured Frankineae bacterium]|uniref:Hydrolase n=1 Tax=uncultured Frankineae bacterium TaxID=437475 RepID=A0A6J4KNT2_9ACTN|nr:MAG: Putative hydrolase [uncultured Frankineae bacterium]